MGLTSAVTSAATGATTSAATNGYTRDMINISLMILVSLISLTHTYQGHATLSVLTFNCYGLKSSLNYVKEFDTGQSAPSVDGSNDGDVTQSTHMKQPTHVKPKWTDPLFVATYKHNLRQELIKIPPLEPQRVDGDNGQCVIDSHTCCKYHIMFY